MRTPATDLLDRLGIAYVLHRYDEAEKTAEEVSHKLALPLETVFKTLLVQSGRDFALAVVPGTMELSLKRLARLWQKAEAEMADPRDIQRVTGYVRGSVSPLGTKRPLPVFLDASAQGCADVAVSAGARGLELVLSGDDLAQALRATFAPLGRER